MKRYRKEYDPPGAVERTVLLFLSVLATLGIAAFIAMLIIIWFLMVPSTRARAADVQVPLSCRVLGELFGQRDVPATVSIADAESGLVQGKHHPGANTRAARYCIRAAEKAIAKAKAKP